MKKMVKDKAAHALSNKQLAVCILHALWRVQDAGGVSGGRSWENRNLEAVMELLHDLEPKGSLIYPDVALLDEAQERIAAIKTKRINAHFRELDRAVEGIRSKK